MNLLLYCSENNLITISDSSLFYFTTARTINENFFHRTRNAGFRFNHH